MKNCLLYLFLLVWPIGVVLGIIFRKRIGEQQQRERSLIGIDFHNRDEILKEQFLAERRS